MKSFIIAIMASSAQAISYGDVCQVSAKDCETASDAGMYCGAEVAAFGNDPTTGECVDGEELCDQFNNGGEKMLCPNLVYPPGPTDGEYVKGKFN